MTRAAYQAAIDWAALTRTEVGLECDIQFSADDQLVCLHDLTLLRTAARPVPAFALTVAELKQLDFGSWRQPNPSPEQREMLTLAELLSMVAEARAAGVPVTLAIETKHPNPRSLDVEDRVAEMLVERGWHRTGSPVRLISFSLAALDRLGHLLPEVPRTLLVQDDLGLWRSGRLPEGIRAIGPRLGVLKADPGLVARARAAGNQVHVWTVNDPADMRFCRDLGVTGITSDYPELVAEVLAETGVRVAAQVPELVAA